MCGPSSDMCACTLCDSGMGRHLNPTDDLSTGFSLLLMAIGFVLYAYLIGNIGTLLTTSDKAAAEFRHSKELVEVFLDSRKVPSTVRFRVLEFFKVQWDAMKVVWVWSSVEQCGAVWAGLGWLGRLCVTDRCFMPCLMPGYGFLPHHSRPAAHAANGRHV